MKNIYLKDNDFTVCTESSYLYNKVKYFFKINNYKIVDSIVKADIVLINTCWVWTELENKVLDYINRIKRITWEKTEIWIFGCLANRSKKINSIVKYSIPTKKDYLFDELFEHKNSIKNISSIDINKWTIKLHSIFENNLKKYFLEINRWCIHKCSYCGIKQSIWYVTSKPFNEIIKEFKYAVESWYNEIVLVSDDVWSYWYDIWNSFANLFNSLCEIKWDYRININYTEPSEFMKAFPLIKDNFFRVNEIIYPIQSFSDRLLRLMKRTYTVKNMLETLKLMRKYSPWIKITNHIIYWYPTEIKKEFIDNLEWAKLFDANLFNLYSYVRWTKKYNEDEILSKEELRERLQILFKLNKKNHVLYDIANKND